MSRILLIACVAAILMARPLLAAEPDFARDIAPILNKYCTGCHNADDPEGKLALDSFAGIQAGGEKGAILTPGKGDESKLIRVLTGAAKPAMPPEDSEAPTAAEIARLKAWIDAGAKGPSGPTVDPVPLMVPKIKPTVEVPPAIHALAIAPSGEQVALARFGEVHLVSAEDGKLVRKLVGHRGRVNAVAFSRDGKLLVSGAGEPALSGEAIVWNVATGEPLRTYRGHKDALYAVAISPNGATIATAGYDQAIKLWSLDKDEPLATLDAHNGAVFALAFRPDGKVLASASEDRTVKLWDVARGTRLDTLSQSTKELYTLAFAPDGERLAAAGVDNRIRVWGITPEAREGTNPLVFSQFAHEAAVLRLAYADDGKTLVSTGEDRIVKVWNASNMTLRKTLPEQPDWVSGVAVFPDNREVLISRLDGATARFPLGEDTSKTAPILHPLPETPPSIDYGPQPAIKDLAQADESEPNDTPAQAVALAAPGVAKGKIEARASDADVDLYRFTAKAGEQWILETNAARSGSPLDSKIEVLHGDGRPVERLLLRAVRDSSLEFRGMDSNQRGARLQYWEEILLRQYIYMSGEVCKQFQQRRGPDADSQFYPEGGARITYFDTTARAHALGEPCYVVVPYAIGTELPDNGLPVFTLNYENDDDGQRKLGKDSRLTFVAPADGDYLVRVSDVRGFGGDAYHYQLVLRRPQPDFRVKVEGANPTIGAGSGKPFVVKAERIDNFQGPITVEITGLPPGFTVTSPLVIEPGHYEARGVIAAHPQAPQPTEESADAIRITATADVAGKQVTREAGNLGTIKLAEKPKVTVQLLPADPNAASAPAEGAELAFPPIAEVTIVPGRETTVRLKVERNDFGARIPIDVENLPHGVIVNDIGLNGVLINENETERVVFLACEGWVEEQNRLFQAVVRVEGDQASLPMLLRVRRAPEATAAASR